jgi:hypothetical protein
LTPFIDTQSIMPIGFLAMGMRHCYFLNKSVWFLDKLINIQFGYF